MAPSKVTKAELHPELAPHYHRLRAMEALTRRKWFVRLANRLMRRYIAGQDVEGLSCEELLVPSRSEDHQIRVRVYRPLESQGPLPAVLYCHGGGYLMGVPETAGLAIRRLIATRACIVVAPDYRKSLEHPFPAGFDDCYDTLLWVRDNAASIGARDDRFVIAGHSAGGGLSAALCLRARDEGSLNIAFQMPIYPMIDDGQPHDEARYTDAPVWNSRLNEMAWKAYLAGAAGRGEDIHCYAAPARNTDHRGLPPTITFVGTLDPFHQETRNYVAALQAEGVPVEFREFDDCFHAFELITTGTQVGAEALDFLYESFADYFDKYLTGQLSQSGEG